MLFTNKNPSQIIGTLLIILTFYGCEKEPIFERDYKIKQPSGSEYQLSEQQLLSASDSLVISRMPYYYKFLTYMKESGYTFIDFRTYINSDTALLPQKLLVIRHDVHRRDVSWAYIAFQIEQIVIGSGHSTFYIMLNDPIELEQAGSPVQNLYMKLINYLDSNDVDIQPHISPIDFYIYYNHPYWEKYSQSTLQELFEHNYFWGLHKEGKKLSVRGEDVFDLNAINKSLISLLQDYNQEWTRQTKLEVQGYASHGSATPMNYIINNADLLDQTILTDVKIFEYDTYNTKIFKVLTYLSDNSRPAWMKNPQSIQPARYQFLMHPYQWSY